MTQTATRPYMQVSVQIDTPDAPALDGRVVRTVSWIAIRQESGLVQYRIYAHHKDQAKDKEPLTEILRAESIDPAMVPSWVPWPPAGWLASLELDKPDPAASLRAYLAREGR
jgi:hypothetical protein